MAGQSALPWDCEPEYRPDNARLANERAAKLDLVFKKNHEARLAAAKSLSSSTEQGIKDAYSRPMLLKVGAIGEDMKPNSPSHYPPSSLSRCCEDVPVTKAWRSQDRDISLSVRNVPEEDQKRIAMLFQTLQDLLNNKYGTVYSSVYSPEAK
jgi:hypothetical protein